MKRPPETTWGMTSAKTWAMSRVLTCVLGLALMALENIRQRLELAWPGRARIETEQLPGEFCARLIFPADEVHSLSP